jgi:hypothetical protein
MVSGLLVAGLLSCAPPLAESPDDRAPDASAAAATTGERPLVAILGASMSFGFACPWTDPGVPVNRTVPLRAALAGVWPETDVRIFDRSDQTTHFDVSNQDAHVAAVVARDPDAVVALDFLFWFGYGHVWRDGEGDELAERLALQRRGLALLESLGERPLVVGDYPDMAGADRRMISPRQIPRPDLLAKLNEELYEWAGERPHVVVFPLADWVRRMKAGGFWVAVGPDEIWPGTPAQSLLLGRHALLQSDALHPRRIAMALLTDGLADRLSTLLPEGHALCADPSFGDLLVECRALDDLHDALEDGDASLDAPPVVRTPGDDAGVGIDPGASDAIHGSHENGRRDR